MFGKNINSYFSTLYNKIRSFLLFLLSELHLLLLSTVQLTSALNIGLIQIFTPSEHTLPEYYEYKFLVRYVLCSYYKYTAMCNYLQVVHRCKYNTIVSQIINLIL